MIDIVTMRFGSKYGPEYLQRWADGVRRHVIIPHRLVCFTDDYTVYDPGVHLVTAPDLGGWWNHLWAFSGWTDRRQLLIDLDDVIVGSLNDLAGYVGPHALNSDVYSLGNVDGGCQLIPARANQTLLLDFLKAPGVFRQRYYSDKQYYVDRINHAARIDQLFPGHWVSFKEHCGNGIPENARIVGCHGDPKPASLPVDHPVRMAWEGRYAV